MTIVSTDPDNEIQVVTERKQRPTWGRIGTYVAGLTIGVWILAPIYFLFSMAFTTQEEVRSYPKSVWPFTPFSTDTMRFFLEADGVLGGLFNSVAVAVITLVLSTAIAAPAGYAISRYLFPGRDVFPSGNSCCPRVPDRGAFDSVGGSVHSNRHVRQRLQPGVDAHCPGASDVDSHYRFGVCKCALRARGSRPSLRSFVLAVIPPHRPSACDSRNRGFFGVHVRAVLERSVCGQHPDAREPYVAGPAAQPAFSVVGCLSIRRRLFLMVPSLIFMFFIRKYLFNMWGQVSK